MFSWNADLFISPFHHVVPAWWLRTSALVMFGTMVSTHIIHLSIDPILDKIKETSYKGLFFQLKPFNFHPVISWFPFMATILAMNMGIVSELGACQQNTSELVTWDQIVVSVFFFWVTCRKYGIPYPDLNGRAVPHRHLFQWTVNGEETLS